MVGGSSQFMDVICSNVLYCILGSKRKITFDENISFFFVGLVLYYSCEEAVLVPEISLFFGIRVTMFYSDHNPPHFHAEYAGHKALIDIQGGYVIRGALPARQLKLILAWCELHRDELMQNWELSKDARPLNHIAPLA